IGLFKNGTLIDILGTFGSSSNYAQDQTLVRKADIGSPNASYTTSEWDFFASNTFTDIGVHTYTGSGPNPPATPANLSLLATTIDLNLSWDDVTDEDGYTLYRSADNVSFSSIATLGVDQTSYTDASVALETPYYYYVAAFNAAGTSGNSNTVSGQTEPTPPATPANLSLLATTIDLNLSWDDVANEDGYTLYRSSDNVSFSSIATLGVDQTSYTDASVALETPYYYYVAAFSAAGISGNSNTVSGQTEPVGPTASDLLISEYIEGSSFNKAIEIANTTGASVNLSDYVLKKQTNGAGVWGDDYALSGSLAQGEVWVIANSAANAAILAEADVNTGGAIMSFNGNDAMGLFKNGTLIDIVGVFNDANNFAQNVTIIRKAAVDVPNSTYTVSEWDVFGTDVIADLGMHSFTGGGVNPPTAPANLSLVETTTSLDLSWDDLSNEDGYLVYRSTDNTNFSQVASLTADVTAYVDVSLTLETLYYYYIAAYNVDGNSPNSATVSGQTVPVASGAADLFISEYVEGTQRNRAIEIANFTGASVNLADYSLQRQSNGSGNWRNEFSLSGSLIDGDVFVIGRSDASSGITSVADVLTTASILNISGNDPIGLFKNGVLIDIVGGYNGGGVNFGRNTTLVRKSSVTDPVSTYAAAEWDAYNRNTFTYLGSHVYGTGSRSVPPMLSLNAYPNPFSDYVQISLDLPQSETVSITILNLLGQPVANVQSPQAMIEGEHNIKFNASHLAAGLYILRIEAGTESQTMRIVKQ
ncbi:MAG: lamin tail domain-containing protein, partial [Bacteroidia bacterium]